MPTRDFELTDHLGHTWKNERVTFPLGFILSWFRLYSHIGDVRAGAHTENRRTIMRGHARYHATSQNVVVGHSAGYEDGRFPPFSASRRRDLRSKKSSG